MNRLAPLMLQAILAVPILAGLGVTLGQGMASLPLVLAWPGLWLAAYLSLGPGLVATFVSVGLVLLVLGLRPRGLDLLQRLLAPMLALPHATAALGLAFLIAPSGWIARALSPWATGWRDPPDLVTLNDSWGAALTLGLVLKETPFLLVMALAATSRPMALRQTVAATLGYGRLMGFALAAWPGLYPQLRLPVLAVLAYAMTNVDMALILGPGLPHSLSVEISLWMTDPGLHHQGQAAAGALVQLGLVGVALILWRCLEGAGARMRGVLTQQGIRARGLDRLLTPVAGVAAFALGLVPALGLLGLALWSVAGLWTFPDVLPEGLSLAVWARAAPSLLQASTTTLGLALGVTALALVLTIAALQNETPGKTPQGLIFLPLIVPQIAVLPGIAQALLTLPVSPLAAVALAHLVFVLPYVMLGLAGPFRAWNLRMADVAATLGAGPWRILLSLRLPMLAPVLATTAAVGVAVSVGQYLPTLVLGGGRVATLTTEAVALASGANRRIVGAYGLTQAFWPALAFVLAQGIRR